MEPVHQNLLACLSTLIYIKVIVATCDTLLAKGLLAPDFSRKIVHVREIESLESLNGYATTNSRLTETSCIL